MPFPIEVHSRSSQQQTAVLEEPKSESAEGGQAAGATSGAGPQVTVTGGQLEPAQICQVLDAAGVDTGETYSIEVGTWRRE